MAALNERIVCLSPILGTHPWVHVRILAGTAGCAQIAALRRLADCASDLENCGIGRIEMASRAKGGFCFPAG